MYWSICCLAINYSGFQASCHNILVYSCVYINVWRGYIYFSYCSHMPITVAARSKPWTVFALSNTVIVGLNPTWGMDVSMRLFCVCAALCAGSGLAMGWSPIQGVLSTVQKIKKLKKRPRPNKAPWSHKQTDRQIDVVLTYVCMIKSRTKISDKTTETSKLV
jgi:hypothetical protein